MLVSVQTAARALNVTDATVRRYIERGQVGAVRHARRWRVLIPRSPDARSAPEKRLLAAFPESCKLGAIEAAISRARRENAPISVYFIEFAGRTQYTTLRADSATSHNLSLPPSAIVTRIFTTSNYLDWRDLAGIYAAWEREYPNTFDGCAAKARAESDRLDPWAARS